MGRVCCGCGCNLPRSSFKENECSKGRGSSRCIECAQRHHSYTVSVVESSSGTFRWVAKGKYLSGPRKGQRCVAKWFKNGAVFSDDFFCLDIKAVDKALEIVDRFNQLHIINKVIKINMPAVWRFDDDCEEDWAGQMALCEPYIHNYQKWNSNNGWHDDSTEWGKVMQAISHFSYHTSSGYYVLCDLQGGIHQHEVILSDPVILSQNRRYGITDLGLEGMGTFFSKHTCNEFCRPNWTKPDDRFQLLHSVPGTTMMDLKW